MIGDKGKKFWTFLSKVICSKTSKSCMYKLGIAFIITIVLAGLALFGFGFCKSEDTTKSQVDSGGLNIVTGINPRVHHQDQETQTEWCELQPIDPKKDEGASIEDIRNITDCVRRLIVQIGALESKNNDTASTDKTDPDVCPTMPSRTKAHAINELTNCVEKLLEQATQLKKTDSKTSREVRLCRLLVGCLVVLFISVGTCILITKFMEDHYEESPGRNSFQDVAKWLAKGAEQISEEERHYSNLRFAIFTIFMAVSGALGGIYLNKEYVASTKPIHAVLPIIGLLVTLVFASLEFAIDWIETEYAYMARAVWRYSKGLKFALGNKSNQLSIGGASPPLKWVRGPIWGMFALAALFWIDLPESAPAPLQILALCIPGVATLCFWIFLFFSGRRFAHNLKNDL